MDVIEELKFLGKFTQKKLGGGGRREGRSGWWRGQGECERKIEVFVKIQKKKIFFFWGGGGVGLGGGRGGQGGCDRVWGRGRGGWVGGVGLGEGQGGCDRRIEVFGKIHKKKFGGSGGGGLGRGGGGVSVWWGGVRVDVYEELKFL